MPAKFNDFTVICFFFTSPVNPFMPDFMHNFRPQQNEFKMDRLTFAQPWILKQMILDSCYKFWIKMLFCLTKCHLFLQVTYLISELCQHAGVSCQPAQGGVQCFAQLCHFLCSPQDWSFCGWDVTVSHARADARSQWSQVNGAERRRLSERIFRIQTDTQYSWINMSANLAA